jgi:hypothetical protein
MGGLRLAAYGRPGRGADRLIRFDQSQELLERWRLSRWRWQTFALARGSWQALFQSLYAPPRILYGSLGSSYRVLVFVTHDDLDG